MLVRVLLGLPKASWRRRVQGLLAERSVITSCVAPGEALLDRLERSSSDLVILARSELPEDPSAMAGTVAQIRQLPDRPELIVLVDRDNPAMRAALLSAGVLAVVDQGLPEDVLGDTLRTLIRRRREDAQRSLRAERAEDQCRLSDFVSKSPTMELFLEVVSRVVPSSSSLLVLGETGVGKERLARAIHAEGPRAKAPFLAVNCAALPEGLLETELFGHEEGAFTGATRARRGYFELAHRGTIFLDEIGELPPHLQVKLLRVLQERRIQPIGGETSVGVDVRVMAASNRDVVADMRAGKFRADLYYRLGVVTLTVPPLRERREDIPTLVESYLEHFRVRLARPVVGIEPAALEALTSYPWPGNVRELINVLERAVLLSSGPRITLGDLPPETRAGFLTPPSAEGASAHDPSPRGSALLAMPWQEARLRALESFERTYLEALLQACGGRIGEAARRAQINPRFLYDKMRQLGLRKEGFRRPASSAASRE